MSIPFGSSSRRITARLAVVGIVGISCLAVTSAAFASPVSKVRSHLRHAHRALDQLASGAVSGNVSVPLLALTSQLGIAANITTNLAIHADTPNLERTAAKVLSLVAGMEAQAENVLTGELSMVSGADEALVLTADLQVTQARGLALSALSDLALETTAKVGVIENTVTTLSTTAEGLLASLVTVVTRNSIGCPSISAFAAEVASDIPATVHAELNPLSVTLPVIGTIVNANGSLLAGLVSQETSATKAAVSASSDCVPSDGAIGSLGVRVSGNASVSGVGSVLSVLGSLGLGQ
jgi:hypothetical protein